MEIITSQRTELKSWSVAHRRPNELLSTFHDITVLHEDEELERVLELDNLAFEGQIGTDLDYLRQIRRNGMILGIEGEGRLLAQAQIVCKPIPDAPEMGVSELPENCAYFEGLAIHPDAQGKGLGQALILAAEEAVGFLGKNYKFILTTARLENTSSLAAFTKSGYIGVGVDNYYSNHDNRVLLLKNIRLERWQSLVADTPASEQRRLAVETNLKNHDYKAHYLANCAMQHQGRALTSVEPSETPQQFIAVFSPINYRWLAELNKNDKLFGSCAESLDRTKDCWHWNRNELWPLTSETTEAHYQGNIQLRNAHRYWGSKAAQSYIRETPGKRWTAYWAAQDK